LDHFEQPLNFLPFFLLPSRLFFFRSLAPLLSQTDHGHVRFLFFATVAPFFFSGSASATNHLRISDTEALPRPQGATPGFSRVSGAISQRSPLLVGVPWSSFAKQSPAENEKLKSAKLPSSRALVLR